MAKVDLPAGYAPQHALAYGKAGEGAVGVDADAPLPVESGAGGSFTLVIAAGTALSPAIDLDRQRLHRVAFPAAWTAAAISFQVSADGAAFVDLYDRDGELTLPPAVVGPNRSVVVDPAAFIGVRFLKLRSGVAASPVAQAADRTLTLVTVAR